MATEPRTERRPALTFARTTLAIFLLAVAGALAGCGQDSSSADTSNLQKPALTIPDASVQSKSGSGSSSSTGSTSSSGDSSGDSSSGTDTGGSGTGTNDTGGQGTQPNNGGGGQGTPQQDTGGAAPGQ
ncbi:MAG: hypothetical protein ACRDKI_05345 [Solirubrobacterales bacterium]